jgi:hypothetical protein
LDKLLSPGDVLFVEASDPRGIMRLGQTGGAMGHVLLVAAPPRGVSMNSPEGVLLQNVWPAPNVRMLWIVPTMESCRAQEGFHETEYFVYIDGMGQILFQGENAFGEDDPLTKYVEPQIVQVFQSPRKLRENFRPQIMHNVLNAMRDRQASWSWSTAVRAFLFSAEMQHRESSQQDTLNDIRKCWLTDPICTSVVIVFWQRYLCELAAEQNAMHNQNQSSTALDWIMAWMPLKADRSLPGDLLNSLETCGWNYVSGAPRIEECHLLARP